jgi:hypothetical protein
MSDDKAISITNQVFQERRKNAVFPHIKTLICRAIGKNNLSNTVDEWASDVENHLLFGKTL